MNEDEVLAALEKLGARLRPKNSSRLMRWSAVLLRWLGNPHFMEIFWTTIGRTIYYPSNIKYPETHVRTLMHELVHVEQWIRWWILLWVTYILLPLPMYLAWFRFKWEREAYMQDIRIGVSPKVLADVLWRGYAKPWPKKWMEAWFTKQAKKEGHVA